MIATEDDSHPSCPVAGCDTTHVSVVKDTEEYRTYHCRRHGRVRWWYDDGETERLDEEN